MIDVIVVGGGIVGVATARRLAADHAEVLLLEKEPGLATHQTGHNSNVVHSGIYYAPGSLKAELCRAGASAITTYARARGIPLQQCGKLLVATNEAEVDRMRALHDRAHVNGIEVELLDAAELRRREPNVRGLGALFVAQTAITDYVAITRALADDLVAAGGDVRCGVTVLGLDETPESVTVHTSAGDFQARRVLLCGGVQADRLARMAGLDIDFRIVPFRGEYFDVRADRSDLVHTLIYPIPDPDLPFLGVHLTPTVEGGLNVGPNAVLGLSREGYPKGSVDWHDVGDLLGFSGMWRVAARHAVTGARELRDSLWKRGYLQQCRKYCPSLELDDLEPRPAGIRAQAVMRDGTFVHDFLLRSTARTLHVVNAPSPAATSALPIADRLVHMLAEVG